VFHRVHRRGDGMIVATGEQMHLHVDTAAGKAVAMDAALHARLAAMGRAHSVLPVPVEAGRPVGSRAKH
ncbi:MAG: 4-hydroxybenzoyl-CoA thioesterase, partial [Pseudomonadota bacterium]|nr:4-hydroxybenzoyl-CoA thioesterase [Pseudomonadota bacterium]